MISGVIYDDTGKGASKIAIFDLGDGTYHVEIDYKSESTLRHALKTMFGDIARVKDEG